MPYKKKVYKKKRLYKRRPMRRYRRAAFQPEKKFYQSNLAITASGTVTGLNLLAQGVTQNTRVGNSITLKSLYMRGYIIGNATAQSINYRIMIIQDNQQVSDTTPVIADIYVDYPYSFSSHLIDVQPIRS